MKRALMASAVAAALVGAASIAAMQVGVAAPAPSVPQAAKVPEKVDNFQLTDHTRLAHELYYFSHAKAVVVMTQTNGSKLSREAAAELQKVAAKYKSDPNVMFYMINSNIGDTRDATAKEAKAQGFAIPVLMDEYQLVGENLGVTREAEVFVFEPGSWKVAYHGPLDDRFAKASPNAKAAVKEAYVADAVAAVLSKQPVTKARVDLKAGKSIAFPERARAGEFSKISYSKEVSSIIEQKCVACHQKGGIAPFAFDSYEVVKGMAPMIRESVRTERMPPYFADPHIGAFKNNHALSTEQTKTLIHWIEAGAPRGDGPDVLKQNAKVAPDWPESLGKPDVIIDIPAFTVPASGVIPYENPRVKNPFTEDTWLRAIAVKPGERSVLHHVTSNWSPDRTPGAAPAKIPGGSVGSYTPGAEPQVIADNAGAPVPAGGTLNFSMHYTTSGKVTTDKTQVGFYTHKTPPKYVKRSAVIGDFALSIPAGESRHKEVAYLEFPADAELYTLYPHAHYRGYHVELKHKKADGSETMLISLPKYDFNWQRDYDPVEPIMVKKGDKLIATWVYDNSDMNKANPDPTINVTWGEQSFQEMMYFRVNYRWMDETRENIRNDLQSALMESRNIGALDDNANGKVEKAELRGPMAAMQARFADLDLNKDGGLDAKEMAAGGVNRAAARGRRQAELDTPDL